MSAPLTFDALPVPPQRLGESPLWHPQAQCLYWLDIPGRELHRWDPAQAQHRSWALPAEAACCAAMPGDDLLLAMRDGLWRFDTVTGQRHPLAPPPYDPARERFNDGRVAPDGSFWVGTIYEPREPALAALYRWDGRQLTRMAGDIVNSNGLAWSPGGDCLYWADTKAHLIRRFPAWRAGAPLPPAEVWQRFPLRAPEQALDQYGGRPDGAAVDAEGAYWCAMYEGQRLLRIGADGRLLQTVPLPVRCPTMPCLGGPDGRTLFVTTAREGRPAEELDAQPLAGRVLVTRVAVPGVPAGVLRV